MGARSAIVDDVGAAVLFARRSAGGEVSLWRLAASRGDEAM